MNRFGDVLRDIDARLDLPQPARSRLLLEIAADLDQTYATLRERGVSAEDAHREAVDAFDLSSESLDQLARVHCGPVRRALDRLSADALPRWERLLLFIVILGVVLAGSWWDRGDQLFRDAGPFAWPVVLVFAAALGVAAGLAYRLFLKQDHRRRGLRRHADSMLVLVVLMAFLGFAGSWFEVWRLAGEAIGGTTPVAVFQMRWALLASALLQVSLGLALLSALAWFGLAGKVSRIERYEAESRLIDR